MHHLPQSHTAHTRTSVLSTLRNGAAPARAKRPNSRIGRGGTGPQRAETKGGTLRRPLHGSCSPSAPVLPHQYLTVGSVYSHSRIGRTGQAGRALRRTLCAAFVRARRKLCASNLPRGACGRCDSKAAHTLEAPRPPARSYGARRLDHGARQWAQTSCTSNRFPGSPCAGGCTCSGTAALIGTQSTLARSEADARSPKSTDLCSPTERAHAVQREF